MDDDLPSLRIVQLNKTQKILLIIFMGLFFSFYFRENCRAESSENKLFQKEMNFRFDPMKRIKNQVTQENEKAIRTEKENNYYALMPDRPMEKMVPFIAQLDSETASFLIAIAKKESDWGKYSPKKAGVDCYNYWGYRGAYNQTRSGYSCFDSPEQAVMVVGARIRELLEEKINTPEKMIVWKCGSTCAGHDPEGVRKWIADVALYYKKINS